LRQYFPKGTDFNTISDKEIRDVATQLNNRPRKVLNYKTPHEVFWADLKPQLYAIILLKIYTVTSKIIEEKKTKFTES
ncbi:MAG: hypothetical protein NTX05_06555, partial [Fusobacteria bacterium]|nr:hypothetical protein [Fusobacteriota bacterium]